MTIKNKKTNKQTKSESTSSITSASTSSVQKSSTTKTVQQTSNTLQKASSTGKKVRYIEVKVEEDDPLMITDVTDHSISGSTISECYNSHPHYIITEAPSIPDLSQTRHEHHVSDMAQSTTGEFVSSSVLQESSTSHQQSSKSETHQSSTSIQHSDSSHSQSIDRSIDSSAGGQTLNTAFIESSSNTHPTLLTRSQGANATDSFLQSERQELLNQSSQKSNTITSETMSQTNHSNNQKRTAYINSPQPTKRVQSINSDTSKFYGGEGSLDKNVKTKEYTSTSQTNETKSSSVAKSSSSSYVVEIVDGKERIIDSSSREWGDVQEKASSEAYASVSGTGIKPQSIYSSQGYDMQANYDTGKGGQKPTSGMTVKEQSKLIKDGKEVSTHENVITEKDNYKQQQISSNKDHHSIQDQQRFTTTTNDTYSSNTVNRTDKNVNEIKSNKQIVSDRRLGTNNTDSSNFYGYDATIQNQLKKVGEVLQVNDTQNIDFSTKILKSNTSSAQQASSSSYVFEVVDGKEVVVDSSHREWGDSKEHATYEKAHNVHGTNRKPESEYSRHVLDKESHYDTGKDGIPKSSSKFSEESVLYKNGQEVAATSNVYVGDFTKKKAITEHRKDTEDVLNRRIQDTSDTNVDSTTYETTSTDFQSHSKETNVNKVNDFLTTEKEKLEQQNLTKESSSTSTSQTKDTRTTYERSTGTWNGKFVYEKDDDRPRKPKETSPFGRPEQPRHHLKRQDTEENIILSSRDIKDFTSISDLRKIIESSQYKKDVTVSNKNIVINRNIDDRVLKEIIETVKKYPFKRISKVTYGTKINEDVKDLYEGIDTEETTVVNTITGDTTRKSFEVEKNISQIEVTRYITENGITRKITTYEDAKEDDKVRTNVFVDKSAVDFEKLRDVQTTEDVIREYDVVDRAITDTRREDTTVSTVYDETIDRKTVRDDRTIIEKSVVVDETRPKHGGPKKPEHIPKEQCICEMCTCGRHRCPHNDVPEPLFDVEHTTSVVSAYKQDYDEKHVTRTTAVHHEDHLHLEGDFQEPERPKWQPAERPKQRKPEDNLKPEGEFEKRRPDEWHPGERAPVKRPEDNLKPEGDFEKRRPEEWRPGERAPVKRPQDNLKPEGDFEKRRPEEWRPGDREPVRRPNDNLRPEGEFATPEKEPWRPAERQKPKKPEDNLKPEGDFDRPTKSMWTPGNRPDQVKPKDNLHPDGEFEDRPKTQWQPGDTPKQVRPKDNLKPEGKFERPTSQKWGPGEKTSPIKPKDNIYTNGHIMKQDTVDNQSNEISKKSKDTSVLRRDDETRDFQTEHIKQSSTHSTEKHSMSKHSQSGTYVKHTHYDHTDHSGSSENMPRETPQTSVVKTRNTKDGVTSQNVIDKNTIHKTDSRNIKDISTKHISTSTTKVIKQVTEKKLIAGKWVNVTRNIESHVTSGGDSGSSDTVKSKNIVETTSRPGFPRCEGSSQRILNTENQSTSSMIIQDSSSNHHQRQVTSESYVQKSSSNMSKEGQIQKRVIESTTTDNRVKGQDIGNQKVVSRNYPSDSQVTRTTSASSQVTRGSQSEQNITQSTRHSTSASRIIDNSTQRTSDSTTQGIHSQHLSSGGTNNQRSSTITHVSGGHQVDTNTSVSSHTQSHSVNRNQIGDSVTKTSIEFQRAMHGGGETNTIDNSTRSGYHKRTSDLVCDANSANAVLHRKGVSSATEAHHTISSTAAAQRKSIGNLAERGEYISNSTHSSDRKSISSMHRSARDNMAVISQYSDTTDSRRSVKRDGQSTLVVERQPRVTIRDNLQVGGDFYGQSEARSYGSFSKSEHGQRAERSERVEKVERVTRQHGSTSQFVLGDGSTSYKREFTSHVHGVCPATLIETPRTPYKHTRDTREHKFYATKVTQK
ncbi:unnamed protein product [Diatraea saccharalis]|uniref:Titin n=1 Tax=Diatraea saccharalis TaxID=40085 RepID=A0A9P0G415_9NEOP|nr:unnamed protein product [Diatraea saccharalis]